MIQDLKPYPEYKESGLPWLGKVPKHWDDDRLKWLVSNVTDQSPVEDPSENYVALEHVESWTGRIRQAQASNVDSIVKRFRPDDVLFGKLRPYLAKVTRPKFSGVCVGEFFVLRESDMRFTSRYTEHLLRSQPFIGLVNGSTFGAKMPRADWGFVGSVRVPIPPVEEQKAIADYLDAIAAKVRRFIRNRRRLIEVLNEQKQVIINRAVTRGLDPNTPLKPSGIDWLGDIPEHWEIQRTKNFFRLRTHKSGNCHGLELLSIYTHIGVRPRKDLEERGNKASTTDDYWIVRKGDIIVNKLLAWMGAVGVSNYEGVTSPAYDILMPIREVRVCELIIFSACNVM